MNTVKKTFSASVGGPLFSGYKRTSSSQPISHAGMEKMQGWRNRGGMETDVSTLQPEDLLFLIFLFVW